VTRETAAHMHAKFCLRGALFIRAPITVSEGLMINQHHIAHEGLGVLRWLALAAAVAFPLLLIYMTQIR
jgi:hypothetical protein